MIGGFIMGRSLFCIIRCDYHQWYLNISGMNAEQLIDTNAKSNTPLLDMPKYGIQINIIKYTLIERGKDFEFSLEFNYDKKEIYFYDGNNAKILPL